MYKKIQSYFVSEKVCGYFRHLYKSDEYESKIQEFRKNKIKLFVLIIFIGIICAVMYSSLLKNKVLDDGNKVRRNEYGKGIKEVNLIAYGEDIGITKEISFDISEQRYSELEINQFQKDFINIIESVVLDNNESNDNVCYKLKFPGTLEGFPFTILYETDNPMLVNSDGSINSELLDEIDHDGNGVLTHIMVKTKYYDFEDTYSFYVKIFKKKESIDDRFEKAVFDQFRKKDMEGIESEYIVLPETAGGVKISFKEKEDNKELAIIFFSILIAYLICLSKDEEIKKKYEDREKQMLNDYPNIINRFSLYYNTGMTVKAAFLKIVEEYEKEKNRSHIKKYAYEEMVITGNAMNEGVGELNAYDDFAFRCNIQKYRTFVSLLKQAVTKGKKDMALTLMEENIRTFNDRKIKAKQLAEEAGTKMLVPMFMMLSIVIIMIVYPAFASFGQK